MQEHAIVVADSRGYIHLWSPGAEALFGHTAAEAIGRTLDIIVPEEYRKEHWAGFHEAMKAGRSKFDGTTSDFPVLCKDGRIVEFPTRFVFLRDAKDRTLGAMAIFVRPDQGTH